MQYSNHIRRLRNAAQAPASYSQQVREATPKSYLRQAREATPKFYLQQAREEAPKSYCLLLILLGSSCPAATIISRSVRAMDGERRKNKEMASHTNFPNQNMSWFLSLYCGSYSIDYPIAAVQTINCIKFTQTI